MTQEPTFAKDNSTANKTLLVVFLVLILLSIIATYYRIVFRRDYTIATEVSCNPETEACFVRTCNPEEEECTGNPEEDTWYYKIISKNAGNIYSCDSSNEACGEVKCEPGEKNCEEILCDAANTGEGETCNDPATYVKPTPAEGEAVLDAECDEEGNCLEEEEIEADLEDEDTESIL